MNCPFLNLRQLSPAHRILIVHRPTDHFVLKGAGNSLKTDSPNDVRLFNSRIERTAGVRFMFFRRCSTSHSSEDNRAGTARRRGNLITQSSALPIPSPLLLLRPVPSPPTHSQDIVVQAPCYFCPVPLRHSYPFTPGHPASVPPADADRPRHESTRIDQLRDPALILHRLRPVHIALAER